MKLFLFPGLACTPRLFVLQQEALTDWEIITPDWIEPDSEESLETFAVRWARRVEQNSLTPGEACYIGGLSFGGMVAPPIGDYFQSRGYDVRGCILLATVQCGQDIPTIPRAVWKVLCLLPKGGWGLARWGAKFGRWRRGKNISFAAKEVFNQLLDSPCERNRNVLRLICGWRSKRTEHRFPVWHLHGSRDCLLPRYCVKPDETVPRAGHCLTLTHPQQVNDFISRKIRAREAELARVRQPDLP